jgi:hypothetical protein
MDWRKSSHVICFLCRLRYATIELCVLCVIRAERIWELELTSVEFRNSKGRAVWPEEKLEHLVCDVTCAIVTIISRV